MIFLAVIVVFFGLVALRHFHPVAAANANARLAKKPAEKKPVVYNVGITTCRFVDESRSTMNYGTDVSTKGRTLLTEVRYPTLSKGTGEIFGAPPATKDGPFPMIVFGHGYDLTPATYKMLLDNWVKAGFVVAAPLFPDTNASAVAAIGNLPTAEADDVNQPGDVEYVTKQLVADAQHRSLVCPIAKGLINTSKLALAGQSDGATTVAGLAYDTNYDAGILHFDAVAALSGEQFGVESQSGPDPYVATAHSPALLVVQSRTDACNPPQFSGALYNAVHVKRKWFLELLNDDHLPPYTGTDPAAFSVVSKVTTAFFKAMLDGARTSAITSAGRGDPSVAAISSGESAPLLPSLTMNPAQCYVGS